MVRLCDSTDRHVHVTAPCGSGKSSSFLVPALVNAQVSHSTGCRLVVLPYKFLVAHQVAAVVDRLSSSFGVWVESLLGTDVARSRLPAVLSVNDTLPDLIFLSLEAIGGLLLYHFDSLLSLCRSRSIERIYIDELHTILSEPFRPHYEQLRRIGSLGVPVEAN